MSYRPAHHIFLSNCVVQTCHARLVAPSLAIASGEATYTLRRHAADGIPHKFRTKFVVAPGMKTPCAYIWVPFQLRRSLVAFGLDLPVMSVPVQARMTHCSCSGPFRSRAEGAPSAIRLYTSARFPANSWSLRMAGSLEE